MTNVDLVEIAKAMRISYAYHCGDTGLVPWEHTTPRKQAAWLACADAAVEKMLELAGDGR